MAEKPRRYGDAKGIEGISEGISMGQALIYKILGEAYHFFDRRWVMVLGAALASIGLAEAISLLVRFGVPMPPMRLTMPDGTPIGLNYYDFLEAALFFLASFWFEAFIALLAKSEIEHKDGSFLSNALRASLFYPRVFLANISAHIVIYVTFLAGLLALSIGVLGLIFLIPSILFAIWFSLVTPVVVIEDLYKVRMILTRSRFLVSGFFGTVLLARLLGFLPSVAAAGMSAETIYYWPIIVFINISSAIIVTIILVSAYKNLRSAKEAIKPV